MKIDITQVGTLHHLEVECPEGARCVVGLVGATRHPFRHWSFNYSSCPRAGCGSRMDITSIHDPSLSLCCVRDDAASKL